MSGRCCRSVTWSRQGLSRGYRQAATSWCSSVIRTAISTRLACIASGPTAPGSQIALQRGESLPGVETQISFQDMTFSDDGKTAVYWNWETGISPDKQCFVHLMDLATAEDRRMSFDPSAGCELLPRLLGDGRILLERQDDPTERSQLLIAPIDGPGPGLKIGEVYNSTYGWDLSPDRGQVIFAADLGPGMLISTDTGAVEEAPFGLPVLPSWQRLAP